MFEKVVRVQYLNVKTNFCYLSPNITKNFGCDGIVKMSLEDDKHLYFAVGTEFPNIPDDIIGINSIYAKLLQIEEGLSVVVTSIDILSKVQSFTIYPVRTDDFHVLDLLKTEIENCVLDQTKIVNENQELIIWIGNNLYIPVKVALVIPTYIGLLSNLTELVILPQSKNVKVHNDDYNQYITQNEKAHQFKTVPIDIFNVSNKLTKRELQLEKQFKSYSNRLESFHGRLVPSKCLNSSIISNYLYDFSIFILNSAVPLSWKTLDTFEIPLFCSLEIVNHSNSKLLFVRVFLISKDILDSNDIKENNTFAPESLFKILGCKVGANIILRVRKKINCDEILIHAERNENIKNSLKEYFADICKYQEFVLNVDAPIVLKDGSCCTLKFLPPSRYCCVDEELLRKCKYRFVEEPALTIENLQDKTQNPDFIVVSSHQQICDSIVENLKTNIIDDEELTSSVITGNMGCGKSALIEKISNSLSQAPLFLYCDIVKCKTLKGKSVDSLNKTFVSVFETLVSHKPAVLFIDDLHILCENIADTDTQAQNVLYYDRTSEMLYSLFESISSHYQVGIIATTESTEKLNKHIYNSRGCYLFGDVHNITDLTKRDRSVILSSYLKMHSCDLDFDDLAQKTEGYVFQDLFDFSQKAIFHSIKDDFENCENSIVTKVHCDTVLSQMTILSLSEIKLHSSGDKDFSNIGGMTSIKVLLTETLMWPLKYPNLFDTAPIRLQSGLLLYGPPGTGKTLLAGATAKEFGIRLISIKGPELLSKYIGASEQAVRNVFVQAQNAKPCILFFDEFDSLAPRRGHDITGVTDRVVNQLLTQMDGVEALTGVFVIAATSRPDLLDPALLRPGRLDKQIFCPLPDLDSRIDILNVLSRALILSEDVDLGEIAEDTDGFSGADLQSLLYTAQLSMMENLLLSKDSQDDVINVNPINQAALKKALSKTKPSLSRNEKQKYDLIYSKFQGNNVDITYGKPGIKASLA